MHGHIFLKKCGTHLEQKEGMEKNREGRIHLPNADHTYSLEVRTTGYFCGSALHFYLEDVRFESLPGVYPSIHFLFLFSKQIPSKCFDHATTGISFQILSNSSDTLRIEILYSKHYVPPILFTLYLFSPKILYNKLLCGNRLFQNIYFPWGPSFTAKVFKVEIREIS